MHISDIIDNLTNYLTEQLQTHGRLILKKIFIAIGVSLVLFFIIQYIVRRLKEKIEQNHLGNHNDIKKVSTLIASIVSLLLWVFNFLIFLQILGLDVAILMGWVTMWFAFALESIIENMIAGIIIVSNKKFTIWDLISIEWNINMTGYIENITLRYTVIKSFDRRKTIIPNTELAKSPFKTIKTEKYIRWEISIHTPRHVQVQQVKNLITTTINQNENIVEPNFTNTIISWFDEKGIAFKGFFLVNPKKSGTGFSTKTQLNKVLHTVFQQYGIKIPYLHVTLDI